MVNTMIFMPWQNEFSVGIDLIDEQHRWLVDVTNTLHQEMNSATLNRPLVGDILDGLMSYTVNHFIVEEELFERHAYPDRVAHKAMHDHLTKVVMGILTDFEREMEVQEAVLELLKNWLTHHILKEDHAYIPFFKQVGITVA